MKGTRKGTSVLRRGIKAIIKIEERKGKSEGPAGKKNAPGFVGGRLLGHAAEKNVLEVRGGGITEKGYV